MLMPTKILVPTDFSAYSDKALSQALDIAAEYKAKVYVLHVINERVRRSIHAYSITPEFVARLENKVVEEARRKLQKEIERIRAGRDLEIVPLIAPGVPYEEILKAQEEQGIDLIVIASLGRTGIGKYIIGSVARNVLRGATCPVLLTK